VRESSVPPEGDGIDDVRWASRVNPTMIRRLYERDALGIVDEDLIDEVGYALYARCRSILQATEAQQGRITCPRCGNIFLRSASGPWEREDEILACERCSWHVRWGDYLKTYQGKHLVGGGATDFHRAFVERFPQVRGPREKMLAIDQLIHAFHWELVHEPGRSAARELIYARNTTELLTFLDRLAYGDRSTPGLQDSKSAWDQKLKASPWHQLTGFQPEERVG
jgi:hypothetical protein